MGKNVLIRIGDYMHDLKMSLFDLAKRLHGMDHENEELVDTVLEDVYKERLSTQNQTAEKVERDRQAQQSP